MNRRSFLKVLGAAVVGLFASHIPKKSEAFYGVDYAAEGADQTAVEVRTWAWGSVFMVESDSPLRDNYPPGEETLDLWAATDESGVYAYVATGEYYHALSYFERANPIWWFCINHNQVRQKHLESLARRIRIYENFLNASCLVGLYRHYCKTEIFRLKGIEQKVKGSAYEYLSIHDLSL